MDNSNLFVSVRQRVCAFKYYFEYCEYDMTKLEIDDLLDSAYRFLNYSYDEDFLRFCAKKENMDFEEYKNMLGNP